MATTAAQITADLRRAIDEDISYARRRKLTLSSPAIKDGFKLLAKVIPLAKEADAAATHSVWVACDATRVSADVYIKAAGVSWRSAPQVMGLIESIELLLGVETGRAEDYTTQWTAQRSYTFFSRNLALTLTVKLPVDGDACSRVQTGVKLVEQPTYELRCA